MKTKSKIICPKCNSTDVIPIAYGYPTGEAFESADRGEIVLGGCVVTDTNPDWHCNACEYEWSKKDKIHNLN